MVADTALIAIRIAVRMLAALAEAPLAGLGLAAGLAMYPSRTAPPELDERPPGRPEPGLVPPPPSPPLPGLVPPDPGSRPGEGGFTPTPPAPPLPGFSPTPAQHPAPPGRPIEKHDPIILHQTRNEGLDGGLRTDSRRARRAAKVSDPAVTGILKDDEWVAHHLINLAAVRGFRKLFAAANRAGLNTDDPANVVALPKTPEAQARLKAAGIDRPLHDSGHQEWNKAAEAELGNVQNVLKDSGFAEDSEAYARAARDELTTLMRKFRQKMLGFKRITQNAGPTSSAPQA